VDAEGVGEGQSRKTSHQQWEAGADPGGGAQSAKQRSGTPGVLGLFRPHEGNPREKRRSWEKIEGKGN
jgi:hypothetical protein